MNNTNKYILDSLGLPVIEDFYELAQEIRISQKLLYVFTDPNNEQKYKTFSIPKKDRSYREINAPIYSLRLIQRWILENILYKMKVSNNCYGFVKSNSGSPTVKNARMHSKNCYILKMDLKNFFPSISKKKVFNVFRTVGYNDYISNALSNICTFKNHLPQGAVTSPYMANLVCYHMDYRMEKYCSKREIVFTRYADDLTFSSNNRNLLHNIYGMVKKIVEDEGFTINTDKTIFMTPKEHKTITGITVNDNLVKAPNALKHKVRAMLHCALVTGNYDNIFQIRGYISYINSIEPDYIERVKAYIIKITNGKLSIYSEIVDAFNKNKLFNDLPNMKVNSVNKFSKSNESDEFATYNYEERQEFLTSHKD